MRWINSSIKLEDEINSKQILQKIEKACRTCYQSLDLIQEGSAEKLIRSCINRGHESVLEHGNITYRVVCDRGVLAEWTRHRIASYSVESTRYCNYNKGKFGSELTFIYPYWYKDITNIGNFIFNDLTEDQKKKVQWWNSLTSACLSIEDNYYTLIEDGAPPDVARAILPNCLKTEIVCTMNIRELRNFFKLRTSPAAHGDIRKLAIDLLQLLRENGLSIFFEDIEVNND